MKKTNTTTKNTNSKGFTLVELMVVVAIIAVLAVVGLTVFTNSQRGARDAKRRSDIKAYSNAYESHYSPTSSSGFYPVLSTNWFAGGSTPVDPLNAAIGGTTYSYLNIPTTAANQYNICATLEAGGTYCLSNQQQ